MLAVDEGGRAAAVKVDRLASPEGHEQSRELAELKPCIDPRAPAVATDGEQLIVADAQRAARVATDGDIGVELRRAAGEALPVLAVDQRASLADQQRARLDEVSARGGVEFAPGREPNRPVDVETPPPCAPRRGDRLVRDGRAADPHLAERSVRIAHEEPRHDRLRMALGRAPMIQPGRLGEADHGQARARERMTYEVHGGLVAVPGTESQQLVLDAVGHRAQAYARARVALRDGLLEPVLRLGRAPR